MKEVIMRLTSDHIKVKGGEYVRDYQHGKWIWDNDAVDWNLGAWICSNCHARNDNIPHSERTIPLRWSGSKFCPNCGCDMRKESE